MEAGTKYGVRRDEKPQSLLRTNSRGRGGQTRYYSALWEQAECRAVQAQGLTGWPVLESKHSETGLCLSTEPTHTLQRSYILS